MQAFVKIGLVPDSGGTFFLPMLVGLRQGGGTRLHRRPHRRGGGLRLGLVNQVVPAEATDGETHALATRLAALPTRAIGLTKRAFNRAMMPDLDAMLDYEADMQELASRTKDYREGVAAFRDKRTPSSRAVSGI